MPKELTIPESKNAETFYISKSFINDKGGGSTSVIVRKPGTLSD